MNSGAHQQVVPNLKKSMLQTRLLSTAIGLTLIKFEIVPFYSGIVGIVILSIGATIQAYRPASYACQNITSFCFSLAPIWMLFLDPCALLTAQTLSATHIRNLVIEENRKNYRTFFIVLPTISWLIVTICGHTFLPECPNRITDTLHKDGIFILISLLGFTSSFTRQVNSILSDLKKSVTDVQELNSKLEVVNGELKQSLEDKDNFILLFSHETRNPLNILIGNLTLLLNEIGETKYKAKLERCKFCAELLLQQLNNILDSGKLASKRSLELSETAVYVSDYIQSISSFMEMLIKKKGTVKSEVLIPEKLPLTLRFDMQRFTQVCLNLLMNSLKFTDSGGISLVFRYLRKNALQESDYYPSTDFGYQLLSLSAKKEIPKEDHDIGEENTMNTQIGYKRQFVRELAPLQSKKKSFTSLTGPEKGFLKIEVNDTGCGMKSEDMKKLFKKFSQTHSDGAQLKIGSGLGLWITKTLCELLGGDVRAYSVPKVGSCFVAIIQADCLPSTRPRSGSGSFSETQPQFGAVVSGESQRILLVDDDPFNLEFHTQMIKSLSYKFIETATDGQKLVEQFQKRPEGYFEAIITDISMPILDGITAAKLVRKIEKDEERSVKVKIGFITGHSNHKDKLICESDPLNCLFYLSKPIKPAILESFLPSLLDAPQINIQPSPQKAVAVISKNANPQKDKNISPPLILCVDDDIFNLDFLEDMIRSAGARTLRAQSGEESLVVMKKVASGILKENIPKLVLVSCRMGKMDGWATTRAMKEILKREFGIDVPIVGVSGDDKGQNQEQLKGSEMAEILQKPILKEELNKIIMKYT